MTAAHVEWTDDVLPGYQHTSIALGADPDGEGHLVATLVRRAADTPSHHVVLAVHGFTDYFFNTELAEYFSQRGFRFYALDLHKCGRSWREGHTPHFTTDLARYDHELQRCLRIIATENIAAENTAAEKTAAATTPAVVVYGHSTGGLIMSLWLDRLRRSAALPTSGISGLILNSPWLDLPGPGIIRTTLAATVIQMMSRIHKTRVIPGTARRAGQGYGMSLHRDFDGDCDYNLQWKPLGGFPVTFGWIHAIRRGQADLHRGLDVGVPNLILRSGHNARVSAQEPIPQRGDAVLDVRQIARWAGCIGNRSTVIPIIDAKHDVFLSLSQPRAQAYHELGMWLDHYRREHIPPTSANPDNPVTSPGGSHGAL